VQQVRVLAAGSAINAGHVRDGRRVVLTLAREVQIGEGQSLEVELVS
jgi:hypothetical protein